MILVAPDGFKGGCSARDAAGAICRGLAGHETLAMPLTDGGEGFLDTLAGARLETYATTNALGEPIEAAVARLGDTVAVELSSAAGLAQLTRRDPMATTTYGVGTLIAAAYPFEQLLLAVGGSATVDGGAGLLEALGARLLDEHGAVVPRGGGGLARAVRLDLSRAHPALGKEVMVAVDVDNPLQGPQGAAAVYGPQKGATPEQLPLLDAGLGRLADLLEAHAGRPLRDHPGMGAAGGVAIGLMALANARMAPGFELAASALGLDEALREASWVITGEGQLDGQSFRGKVVGRLARRCQERGLPLVVLAGSVTPEGEALLAEHGGVAFSLVPGPMPLAEAMVRTPELLEAATRRVGRLLAHRP